MKMTVNVSNVRKRLRRFKNPDFVKKACPLPSTRRKSSKNLPPSLDFLLGTVLEALQGGPKSFKDLVWDLRLTDLEVMRGLKALLMRLTRLNVVSAEHEVYSLKSP